MKNVPLDERIIFALDFADAHIAKEWVEKLDTTIRFFKVGLQLFLAAGWPIVDFIIERGNKVMVDLKFFDIPETVALAVQQLQNRKITFATIHGNEPIIKAALQHKGDLNILAVTVLTSFDESDLRAMGLTGTVNDLVLMRAQKAIQLGCDGVVSSALEASALRQLCGNDFTIVTPGIRLNTHGNGLPQDDQRRIATAEDAILNGADHVVIGRPISTSPTPLATIQGIQKDIMNALQQQS